jgi:hypothetical protein
MCEEDGQLRDIGDRLLNLPELGSAEVLFDPEMMNIQRREGVSDDQIADMKNKFKEIGYDINAHKGRGSEAGGSREGDMECKQS